MKANTTFLRCGLFLPSLQLPFLLEAIVRLILYNFVAFSIEVFNLVDYLRQMTKALTGLSKERFLSLDLIRGIAMLGILFMNIQSFSMINAAYANPLAFEDLNGINYWVWYFSHLLADSKFMTLFSVLFGAGMVLFAENAVKKGLAPTYLFLRRNFLLLIIGLIHAYFLWFGDILFSYAVCGFMFFFFRNSKSDNLINWGIFLIAFEIVLGMGISSTFLHIPEADYTEMLQSWQPNGDAINEEIAIYQGSYSDQLKDRMGKVVTFQTFGLLIYTFWRSGGLMLIGMALYKNGFLTGQLSNRFYTLTGTVSLIIGLAITAYGIDQQFGHGWTMEYSMLQGSQFNYVGSLGTALGYACFIILFAKMKGFDFIKKLFSNVGRMALSNYILQSIICTFIFYGFGLGWFAETSRFHQLLVVLLVSTIQIVWSTIWLQYFKQGPLEMLWKRLTYTSAPAKID